MRFSKKIENIIDRYRLIDDNILDNCLEHIVNEYIRRSNEGIKKPLNIILTDEDEARTLAQNRIMWKWYTQIGNKWGMTKDEVHDIMRAMFLLQIYRTADPDYEAIASNHIGDKIGDDEWHAKVQLGRMCSTTGRTATIKVMSEYLNDIYKWSYMNNIPLVTPDDLKWAK